LGSRPVRDRARIEPFRRDGWAAVTLELRFSMSMRRRRSYKWRA